MISTELTVTQVKETCIYVDDLQAAKKFYSEVLGLPVIAHRPNRHVFFRAGTSVLLCFNPETTKKETQLPPHFAYGPQHLAFEVNSNQYQSWKKALQAKLELLHEQTWEKGQHSFYFKDPAGNVLEIVEVGMWDH